MGLCIRSQFLLVEMTSQCTAHKAILLSKHIRASGIICLLYLDYSSMIIIKVYRVEVSSSVQDDLFTACYSAANPVAYCNLLRVIRSSIIAGIKISTIDISSYKRAVWSSATDPAIIIKVSFRGNSISA